MGRTCLLKNLVMNRSHFDKLYIIVHTGDQYEGFNNGNTAADVEFIGNIIDLSSLDQQPNEMESTMIIDEVRANEKLLHEYF